MAYKISDNFTLEEMHSSSTAKKYGINNTPSADIQRTIVKLVSEILQPVREEWGAPIKVTSGYRCPKLNSKVGGAKNSDHCLDRNTEVLTNNGWKTYKTIKPYDKVFSYNIEKDIIELTPIDSIILRQYDGNLYYGDNKHINFAVTDEHRMLIAYASQKYSRITTKNLSEASEKYISTLRTNNDKYHIELMKDVFKKRRKFKCAGISSLTNEYDINILRMCMAVISDGFICHKENFKPSLRFHLVKKRDCSCLEDILEKLQWHYTKREVKNWETTNNVVYDYTINGQTSKEIIQIIGMDKKIPYWFLTLKPEILKELIVTYANFDGSIDERPNCNEIMIFSKDEENIDMLQSMSVLCNMRAIKKELKNVEININGQNNILKKFYRLYINQKQNESRLEKKYYRKFYYKGEIWCVNNRNTTLITRRNGKVMFIGNCYGAASDITTTSDKPSENKKLFDLIVKMANEGKIHCRQIIDEYNYNWIHVSINHKNNSNKDNQILHLK